MSGTRLKLLEVTDIESLENKFKQQYNNLATKINNLQNNIQTENLVKKARMLEAKILRLNPLSKSQIPAEIEELKKAVNLAENPSSAKQAECSSIPLYVIPSCTPTLTSSSFVINKLAEKKKEKEKEKEPLVLTSTKHYRTINTKPAVKAPASEPDFIVSIKAFFNNLFCCCLGKRHKTDKEKRAENKQQEAVVPDSPKIKSILI